MYVGKEKEMQQMKRFYSAKKFVEYLIPRKFIT